MRIPEDLTNDKLVARVQFALDTNKYLVNYEDVAELLKRYEKARTDLYQAEQILGEETHG